MLPNDIFENILLGVILLGPFFHFLIKHVRLIVDDDLLQLDELGQIKDNLRKVSVGCSIVD